MRELHIPSGVEWELLVVDNNCTDDTAGVVESFANALPVKRLLERKQGQSNARNRAMDEARGDLLIWTDDDVLVDQEWIAAYVTAAERWPEAGYFGGLITPWFEQDPPSWFRENGRLLESVMVTRDLGPKERMLNPGEPPYGANMAFRRSVFSRQRFDPNLGLVGDNGIRYDETEYCRRLQEAGTIGVWVPDAKVRHFVVAKRMTLGYVWKHFEGDGRAQVRMDGNSTATRLFGAPRWIYRAYLAARADGIWRRARRNREWLPSYARAAQLRGMIREHRRLDAPSSRAK